MDMRIRALLIALLILPACGGREQAGNTPADASGETPVSGTAATEVPAPTAARWDLQSSGEGVALALLSPSGATEVRLFCPAGDDRVIVNVQSFKPVGSEERMTFGSDGKVEALVADARGDAQRGGVSGAGPVPANLSALMAGPLTVNYGAQSSGPHPAVPEQVSSAFVASCREGRAAQSANPTARPCLMQGDMRLDVQPLKAVGTEPFWATRIEGRCVTYSHPENIDGTRVWTRYSPRPGGGGSWIGALQGRAFELHIRSQPGCSDGMSDKLYPFSAELLVQGESRRGCAEPA